MMNSFTLDKVTPSAQRDDRVTRRHQAVQNGWKSRSSGGDIGGYCVSQPYAVCAILSTSVVGPSAATAGRRPAKIRKKQE